MSAAQMPIGGRVLVVDDNLLNRRLACEALSRAGFEVDEAVDGSAAIELARGRRYAAILLDVHLPGLDGTRAAAVIRTLPQHAHTAIIGVSGSAGETTRGRCRDAGMDDFLRKPLRPRLLCEAVARWLGGGPPRAD